MVADAYTYIYLPRLRPYPVRGHWLLCNQHLCTGQSMHRCRPCYAAPKSPECILTPHMVMPRFYCVGTHCITHVMPHFRLLPTSRMSCSSCCLLSMTPRPPHHRPTPSPRPPRTPLRSRTPSRHSAAPPLPRPPLPRDKTRSLPKLLGHGHLTRAGRSVTGPILGGPTQSGTSSK